MPAPPAHPLRTVFTRRRVVVTAGLLAVLGLAVLALLPSHPTARPTADRPAPSATTSASTTPTRSAAARPTLRPHLPPAAPRRPAPAANAKVVPSSRTSSGADPRGGPGAGSGGSVGTSGSYQQQVVDLTNQQRSAHGCPALTVNGALTSAAQGHSADMAAHNYFDHTSQDGRTMTDRVNEAGYTGWTQVAENIAAGQSTPSAVVDAWMNSPGHRANILNCGLREIGVGYATSANSDYKSYWTQDFGTR